MADVEERVVGMRFDNSKFQSGIAPVLSLLDKLKASLKLDGAAKGIEEVNEAGKKFSLDPLMTGVEGVSGKFVALATIGITALSNIVNKAIDAGTRIMNALTIDPIKAGFDEYELKMGSIQTILANTARYNTGLPEVVASLDELNTYADKTIYNFGDMTKNIGLFTNAGIGIKDATSMIKGFSNEAAASGTSSQGAAGAAYQLSQALSAGTIRLMDWRSLSNVGMGNKNMQQGIADLATAMGAFEGKGTDAIEVMKDFPGSLEKGWLSADVMSTYLKIMAGDMDDTALSSLGLSQQQIDGFKKQQQTAEEAATKVRSLTQLYGTMQEAVGSGWAQSFDIIVGDFDEATELFTAANNTLGGLLGQMSDARNKVLTDWDANGGRTAAIDAIAAAFRLLMAVLGPIKEAFVEIFPPATGEQIATITKNVRDFIQGLVPGTVTMNNIKATAKGLFAAMDIGWMVVKEVIMVIADLLRYLGGGTGDVLAFTGSIGDFIVKIRDAIKNGAGLSDFFYGLSQGIIGALGYVKTFISFIGQLFVVLFNLGTSGADAAIGQVQDRLASIGNFFTNVLGVIKMFGAAIVGVFGIFGPLVQIVGNMAKDFGSALTESFSSGNFDTLVDLFNTGLLAGIGVAIFKFVGLIKSTLSQADPGESLIGTIKGVFGELSNTMQAMQGSIKADILMKIAAAVGILTLSVIALSLIDTGKLFIALAAIATMFVQLGAAMAVFDKMFTLVGATKLTVLAVALTGLGVAMLLFSGAIAILGAMSPEQLATGLIGLAGALAIMSGAMMLLSKAGPGAILGSAAMTIAAVGISIIAGALQLFALLSWDDIGRAMVALGGSLAILAAGLYLMSGALPGAAALTIASVGIALIAGALLLFAQLSWDDIGRAMTTLGGTLAILAVGLTLMVAALPGAAALVVASVGLAVIAGVLQLFALLSWDDIGRGMTVLGGTLGILALGLTLMIAALPGAAALVVAAAALTILAPVLMLLGSMSWEQIGTGLTVLALALGILAIAGYALIPAVPGLLGLGAAVLLLGTGVLAAGLGITALGVGLTALSVGAGAAITVITGAVSALAALIPYVLSQIGLGLIEIVKIIGENGPAILQAITTVLLALIQAIVDVIPPAVDAIVQLVTKLVEALIILIPLLVDGGMRLIIGILDGIARNIGKVIEKGTDVIVAFLDGVGKAIPRIAEAGANLVIDFINGIANTIRSKSGELQDAGANVASAIVEGMAGGIRRGVDTVVNAAKTMANNALQAAKNALGIKSPSREFKKVGGFSTEGLAIGLIETSSVAEKAGAQVGKNTLIAVKKSMANAGQFMTDGGMDFSPTIRPVLDLTGIKKDAGLISGIVGRQELAVDGATARANAIALKYGEFQQAKVDASGPTTEVNMTQNNYSPKALPEAEIYRQSKNQISILKGELEKSA